MSLPGMLSELYEKTEEYINTVMEKSRISPIREERYRRRIPVRKTGESVKTQSFFSEAVRCLLYFVTAAILGSAVLPYDVYPLGTALTLSVAGDKYAFSAFIGSSFACIGYGDEAAAFFAVNTLCFFARAFLTSFRFDDSVRKRLTVCAFISLICAVIISAVGGFRTNYIMHGVSYSVCLMSACLCFCSVIPPGRKRKKLVFSGGALAVLYILTYALSKIPMEGFSPSVAFTAFTSLYCSSKLGPMYGLTSGLVCGIAASPYADTAYAISAGLAGFTAGFFGEKNEARAAFCYKIVFSAVLLYINGFSEVTAVISTVTASLLYIATAKLLPGMTAKEGFPDIPVGNISRKGFDKLSGAFSSLSEVVYNISDKLKYPSEHEVKEKIDAVLLSQCKNCSMSECCYGRKQCENSEGDVRDIIYTRLTSGGLSKSDIPDKYLKGCIKLTETVIKLNEGYSELVNEHFKDNKTEILASEYSTMARLIKHTSQKAKTDKTPDKQLHEAALSALASIGVRFTSVEAYGERMKTVDVYGVKLEKFPCTSEELARYMSEKCGILFDEPEFIGIGENTMMRLTRKRKIKLEYARCACAKDGKNVNGDSASFFESDEHYFYALISDGMGSGRSAALTSRLTSVFIEKLLTTGAHKTVTLEMLNNLLLSKNDESFATVDLLEIDLLSGEASFIKAGAAPAYVLRASKLYKIASFTPPAGIIRSFNAENTKFTLEKGDTVMMLSDGIVQSYDEVPWLCELLSADKNEDPARLSERVLNKAKKINLRRDDMTCVAVRVM